MALLFATATAGALEIDDFADKLASADPALRREALDDLKQAGDEQAIAWLKTLLDHEDPWLATRAARLLYQRLGLDPQLPLEIQRRLAEFTDLNDADRKNLLDRLGQPGTGHLAAVIFLLESHPADHPVPDDLRRAISGAVAFHQDAVAALDVNNLKLRTRAELVALFPTIDPGRRTSLYAQWRKLDPAVRHHLPDRGLALEINFLGKSGNPADWFRWIAGVDDPARRSRIITSMRNITVAEADLDDAVTDPPGALGCLEFLMQTRGPEPTFKAYLTLLARFPDLSGRLFDDLRILQVRRLEEAGDLTGAIRFASHGSGADRSLMTWARKLGRSLEDEPQRIEDCLPEIAEPRATQVMAALLAGYFPMAKPRPGYTDVDEKVATFDRWAQSPEWLDVAWTEGPVPLYQLTLIRRGQWNDLLLRHEQALTPDAHHKLGALLALRPALRKDLPVALCEPATLRTILDGALQACPYSPASTMEIADLAEDWSRIHPGLLADAETNSELLLQLIHRWRTGESEPALTTLLGWIFAAPVVGQVAPNARERSNLAQFVLFDLLGSDPDADPAKVLTDDRFTQQMLELAFRRITEAGGNSIVRVRCALVLARTLREKFGVENARMRFGSIDAEQLLLDVWLSGGPDADQTTGDFLITALVSGTDPEFRNDARFVAALDLLGRTEEALKTLDEAKPFLPAALHASKRGWLLRTLGRTEQALSQTDQHGDPWLWMTLALEHDDWLLASRASLNVGADARREVRRAMIATLSADPQLLGRSSHDRHTAAKLVMGIAESDDDLAAMAGHARIATDLEKTLGDSLATGQPISSMRLNDYVSALDLLPNPERSAAMLHELGMANPGSEPHTAAARETHLRNKLIAAGALARMGHADHAFDVLRSGLKSAPMPAGIETWKKAARVGISRQAFHALEALLTLAAHEWPDRDFAAQLDGLASCFAAPAAPDRTAACITLIEKHAGALSTGALLDALILPLADAGRAGKIPAPLEARVRAWFDHRELTAADRKQLAYLLSGYRWQKNSDFPPPPPTNTPRYSSDPPVGESWNPRAAGFQIIDGVARVAKVAESDQPAAERLLRDIMIRVLLDDRMMSETDWRIVRLVGRGRHSSSFDTRGAETVLVALEAFGVPPEISSRFMDHASTPRTGYADADREWRAAKQLAAAGRHRRAVMHFRRFLIIDAESGTDRNTGDLRQVLVRMHRSLGLIAAADGDWNAVVENLSKLVIFSPFDPQQAAPLLGKIAAHHDPAVRAAAKEAVDRFWRTRRLEMPHSRTYAYWQGQWNAALPD
ncbi:MAG: hypothetical protein Q7R22_003415 [Verrucomicrobiota bacterium JB025]|nr:hypothetical protein [Verrucomicrobiota bacterium JB025]